MVVTQFGGGLIYNILSTTSFLGYHSMVWRCISTNGYMDLVLIHREGMNTHGYIKEILQNHLILFAPFVGDNFIKYLVDLGINRIDWRLRNFSLNHI